MAKTVVKSMRLSPELWASFAARMQAEGLTQSELMERLLSGEIKHTVNDQPVACYTPEQMKRKAEALIATRPAPVAALNGVAFGPVKRAPGAMLKGKK